MIWPENLVTCTLFNTLHSRYRNEGRSQSRQKFFANVFLGSFCWFWFPGYIFQALSFFNWVCWIAPDNIVVNQLFGYYSGLGMSLITFDWSQIAYISSPLAMPWWVSANVVVGFACLWILAPILYYSNTWYSKFLPMSTRTSYDRFGETYDIDRVLTPQLTLDVTGYENYSPMFLSATFVISYAVSFASITATLVHTLLYHGKQIWKQSSRRSEELPDIHARLMVRYEQVPDWWYATILGMYSHSPPYVFLVAHTRCSDHVCDERCRNRGVGHAIANMGAILRPGTRCAFRHAIMLLCFDYVLAL